MNVQQGDKSSPYKGFQCFDEHPNAGWDWAKHEAVMLANQW